MGAATQFDDNNFETDVLGSDQLTLIDFWAPWCGPCRMLAPVIEELAAENEGKAVVGKLDVDQAGLTAEKYSVTSIPTIIAFKNGEAVERISGVVPKEKLQDIIDAHA